MYIPDGFTEQQITKLIQISIQNLCDTFKFSYYTKQDLEQEGFLYAIEALPRYVAQNNDSDKDNFEELKKFIYIHVRNQFINLQRDKLERKDSPCELCLKYSNKNSCLKYKSKDLCKKWQIWENSNRSKQDLMKPFDTSDVRTDENTADNPDICSNLIVQELREFIEKNIPVRFLSDYYRWLDNVYISKKRRLIIENIVREFGRKYLKDDV